MAELLLESSAPWQLNRQRNKSLEYILGSGSTQFPVTIYYPGDRNNLPEERESDEGTLIVYVDKIKLIKKNTNQLIRRNCTTKEGLSKASKEEYK